MRMPSADARKLLAEQIATYQAQVDGAARYLTTRGLTSAAITRFKLGYETSGSRLVIPYLTPTGAWHLKYRCISDQCITYVEDTVIEDHEGHGKYSYDFGNELHLFNAQTLLRAEYVVVTEGELDAISTEMGGDPAVGYPGTQAWDKNPHWVHCFDNVDLIVVVGDGDNAGKQALDRVSKLLSDGNPEADVRPVLMPPEHDATSFIQEFGVVEYRERLGLL